MRSTKGMGQEQGKSAVGGPGAGWSVVEGARDLGCLRAPIPARGRALPISGRSASWCDRFELHRARWPLIPAMQTAPRPGARCIHQAG